MSNESGRRTLWQALGFYAAGSWILLQVVDVLTQNISLPSWVFLLTLGLLAAGLPITVATAVIQGRAAAQARSSASPREASGVHRIFTWANVVRGGVVALALWGVAVTGWLLLGRDSGGGWDVVAGLGEIERLTNDADYAAAYDIAEELDPLIGNDSARTAMWDLVARTLTVSSEPAGATVHRRDYEPMDAPWEELGTTPVTVERYPFGRSRIRLELEGHEPIELAMVSGALAAAEPFEMAPAGSMPPGMVPVRGGEAALFVPGLEQIPPLEIPDYFLGRLEVTNREYEEFVKGGVYDDPTCWTHPFDEGGQTLSFEEAMDRFVDRTGQPGPSTWEAGTYPDGTADHPVGGLSWYEAEAYACFRGMSLPTVYHWYWEADPLFGAPLVPLSNFGGEGPAPAGSYEGMTLSGTLDMAGNVREWARNTDGEGRPSRLRPSIGLPPMDSVWPSTRIPPASRRPAHSSNPSSGTTRPRIPSPTRSSRSTGNSTSMTGRR
jgi:formylglycine-generating enzyme required for sulfatase activity